MRLVKKEVVNESRTITAAASAETIEVDLPQNTINVWVSVLMDQTPATAFTVETHNVTQGGADRIVRTILTTSSTSIQSADLSIFETSPSLTPSEKLKINLDPNAVSDTTFEVRVLVWVDEGA